jgi:hypothetical protein
MDVAEIATRFPQAPTAPTTTKHGKHSEKRLQICHPCPRSKLLPISPAVQRICSHCFETLRPLRTGSAKDLLPSGRAGKESLRSKVKGQRSKVQGLKSPLPALSGVRGLRGWRNRGPNEEPSGRAGSRTPRSDNRRWTEPSGRRAWPTCRDRRPPRSHLTAAAIPRPGARTLPRARFEMPPRREIPEGLPGSRADTSRLRPFSPRFPAESGSAFETPRSRPKCQRAGARRPRLRRRRGESLLISARSPSQSPEPASSRILPARTRRTKSSSALPTAREYVLSPDSLVASSSNRSSNTRFVRFIHIGYHDGSRSFAEPVLSGRSVSKL